MAVKPGPCPRCGSAHTALVTPESHDALAYRCFDCGSHWSLPGTWSTLPAQVATPKPKPPRR